MHVTVAGTYGADTPVANTFWVRNGAGTAPSQSEFDAFLTHFVNQYEQYFAPQLSNQMAWTNVDGLYYVPGGISVAGQRTTAATGGKAGAHLPANCAICVGWTVQAHYKGGHPRTYLPGPAGDQVQGGRRFLQAYCDAVKVAANNFLGGVNGYAGTTINNVHLGVVSFVLRKEWRSPPVFRDFNPNGAHVDARIDSQRRRLGRDIPP